MINGQIITDEIEPVWQRSGVPKQGDPANKHSVIRQEKLKAQLLLQTTQRWRIKYMQAHVLSPFNEKRLNNCNYAGLVFI